MSGHIKVHPTEDNTVLNIKGEKHCHGIVSPDSAETFVRGKNVKLSVSGGWLRWAVEDTEDWKQLYNLDGTIADARAAAQAAEVSAINAGASAAQAVEVRILVEHYWEQMQNLKRDIDAQVADIDDAARRAEGSANAADSSATLAAESASAAVEAVQSTAANADRAEAAYTDTQNIRDEVSGIQSRVETRVERFLDEAVIVRDTQPWEPENKLWVNTAESPSFEVPTLEEFNAFATEMREGGIDKVGLTKAEGNIRFGVNAAGEYGYYKDGADTLTPFKRPPYSGSYEVTPGTTAQVLHTADLTMTQDIIVNPIPKDYGKIIWDGAKLRIV